MKQIAANTKGIKVSNELYGFIESICVQRGLKADDVLSDLAAIAAQFSIENNNLLQKRDDLQDDINIFFQGSKIITTADVVKKLQNIGYISESKNSDKVVTKGIDAEIYPMAGPQLVVPADKANMVLNAANARWASLYNSLYASNIIAESIADISARKQAVIKYTNEFLDKIISFAGGVKWSDVEYFKFDEPIKNLVVFAAAGKVVSLTETSEEKFIGLTYDDNKNLSSLLFENNSLKIELILDEEGRVKDVMMESAITYIIDLEDASISAPQNKYEAYRIIKGIVDGTLECEVRGETRKINQDTYYLSADTLERETLKRSSLALVRDVGPHMIADSEIITIDGKAIPEKILDCFITSFIGMRYHVAPKMHGAEEVALNVKLWDKINELQGLPHNANKIGIMNEEMRTNAQLRDSVLAAKDIVFFTNTGFLDYTGSFIDLMMYQGAIAPYRTLPSKTYKTSYEVHNVNVSLSLNVPQIGSGMWAAIKDMAGLLKSKEGQVKGLTDTGWSPSPSAAAIHAIAFHIFGNVRQMQNDYRNNMKPVNIEDMFAFPKADLDNLNEKEILENLDFAIHGLLAYAEPWVRRGIGCSGVKDLSGEPLMEDRATARIKAAFARNWLLHNVISQAQLEDSIKRMAKLVDEQNADEAGYVPLYNNALQSGEWNETEEAVRAVYELVINPDGHKNSYVEPYFYAANRRDSKAQ